MVRIGESPNALLEMQEPRPKGLRKAVVAYGMSIVQGGCASRSGMIWTSILGRLLDRPVINLGFSSAGTMERPVAAGPPLQRREGGRSSWAPDQELAGLPAEKPSGRGLASMYAISLT